MRQANRGLTFPLRFTQRLTFSNETLRGSLAINFEMIITPSLRPSRSRIAAAYLRLVRQKYMRKLTQIFFLAAFACGSLSAQTPAWQPSPGHRQVPIWPKEPPDSQPVAGPEAMKTVKDSLVAGKSWVAVERVSG